MDQIPDVLVVGAGFAGCTVAERMVAAGRSVLLMDERPDVGGNATDRLDEHGVMIHPFGPHIFHTNSQEVFDYLSRFTEWRFYEHRVLARLAGELYQIPVNRATLSKFFRLDLADAAAAEAQLAIRREDIPRPTTSEEVVLASVGRELYEAFFRGYTRKQWGREPAALDAQVTARIPVRTNTDDRYFTDRLQFMPRDGYTAMFSRMVDHPLITLELGARFDPQRDCVRARHIVYTGPIDAFFGYALGRLPYRSIRFEFENRSGADLVQPVAVVNEPDERVPYTRTTEFRHLTAQSHDSTTLVREFPHDGGDPFYPVPSVASQELYKRYQALAEARPEITFVGRLAQYRYFNMDQVVGAALVKAKSILERRLI